MPLPRTWPWTTCVTATTPANGVAFLLGNTGLNMHCSHRDIFTGVEKYMARNYVFGSYKLVLLYRGTKYQVALLRYFTVVHVLPCGLGESVGLGLRYSVYQSIVATP